MGLMQCSEDRLPAAPSAPDYGCQAQVSLKCKGSQVEFVATKALETQSHKTEVPQDKKGLLALRAMHAKHQQLALVLSILWFSAKCVEVPPEFLQSLSYNGQICLRLS